MLVNDFFISASFRCLNIDLCVCSLLLLLTESDLVFPYLINNHTSFDFKCVPFSALKSTKIFVN